MIFKRPLASGWLRNQRIIWAAAYCPTSFVLQCVSYFKSTLLLIWPCIYYSVSPLLVELAKANTQKNKWKFQCHMIEARTEVQCVQRAMGPAKGKGKLTRYHWLRRSLYIPIQGGLTAFKKEVRARRLKKQGKSE